MTQEKKLHELIETYLSWKMKNSPTISTMFGYNDYNGDIEDFTPSSIEETLKDAKNFNKKLEEIPLELLDKDNQIDYELLKRDIEGQKRDIEKFRSHIVNPCTYSDIALQSISLLNNRISIPPEEKAGFILKRIEKIPSLLSTAMKNLKNPPRSFREAAIASCYGGMVFLADLIPSLAEKVPHLGKELEKNKEKLLDAMGTYRKFLETDLSGCNGDFATGKELFDELLSDDYMLDCKSEEILSAGKSLFERTVKKLEELAYNIDRTRTWKEIYSDIRLKHPSPEKVIDTYRQYMEKAKNFVIEKDLMDIPQDQTIEIKASPEFLRKIMPTAAYNPPALLDKFKSGIFMVTPVDTSESPEKIEAHLRDHNTAEIITTTLHEAYPGHHLQLTYSGNNKSLIRRHTFTPIFAEGWALYCEQLMKDYGYLEDRLVELSWLRRILWRSLRVIIDISIHTKGMSVKEAVNLMVKELLFSEGAARGEVIRYTMTPTQPLSYLTGMLELIKIREEYKKKEGANYKIKKFHNDLLSCGTLPVRLLRKALL